MVKCPRCGHDNLPSFPTCSRCGTALAGGIGTSTRLPPTAMGVPPPPDEYANLMASRASASKKNRGMLAVVFLAALGAGGYVWMNAKKKSDAVQEKLNFFDHWGELDKRETGAFFGCVMAGDDVDMGLFNTADQIQQRVENAYFAQQKTFSEHLTTDCLPKIERTRQAFGALKDPPIEFAPALAKYQDVLPQLQSGIEEYAEKIKSRQGVKDVDQLIQEMGSAWHQGGSRSPEGAAYERFLVCAIPGIAKMKDPQQELEFMADTCFKKDPVAFMDRVRKSCGPLLSGPPAGKGVKLPPKFAEDDRDLQAWESCGKKSRKGKKDVELASFLKSVGDYMEARAGVAKVAKEIKNTK